MSVIFFLIPTINKSIDQMAHSCLLILDIIIKIIGEIFKNFSLKLDGNNNEINLSSLIIGM